MKKSLGRPGFRSRTIWPHARPDIWMIPGYLVRDRPVFFFFGGFHSQSIQ